MTPFEVYSNFLCLKNHFTKKTYDVIKYNWKTRTSIASFNKRKDRYFYERLSRKKNELEIKEFFISNFVECSNPQNVYIADLMRDGEEVYTNWKKRNQSLSYIFKDEISTFLSKDNFNDVFSCKYGQHSTLIKKYLQKSICIETMVILDYILNYVKDYDKMLDDPIWEFVSMRIHKYKPLINIDVEKYTKLLKGTV
jgi:hypothetical protein